MTPATVYSTTNEIDLRSFYLEFLTRTGCHLCDEALPVVHRVARLTGASVREVQVESDDDLLRQFDLRIPVIREPRGRVLAEGIIEFRPLLRSALAARLRRR